MSVEEIQVFIKGISANTATVRLGKNATIQELFQKYSEHIGLHGDFGLVYGGKELKNSNPNGKVMCLRDYGIEDESNISAVMRLPGGSGKKYGSKVKLSRKRDMLYTDDQAVDMPCGHAIGPNSMTSYVQAQVGTERKYEIHCPDIVDSTNNESCNQPWKFKKIKRAALFTKAERTDVEGKISDNYIRYALKSKECPGCKSNCVRKNAANPRVICLYCSSKSKSNFEFCWICLGKWKTPGTNTCGNENCTNVSIEVLRNCPTIKIGIVPNCPSVRGCPNCGTLIEHIQACKQMACTVCRKEFCFICLKVRNDGGWQCGSYNNPCTVAPRQTVLP